MGDTTDGATGGDVGEVAADDTADGPATPPPPLSPSPAVPAGAGVAGTAIRRSDTSDVPDIPVGAGTVLVIPAAGLADFWTALDLQAEGPPQLGIVEVTVPLEALPADAEAVPLGADGSFASGVPPGEVLLCLADDRQGMAGGPPHRVTGCVAVRAAEGSPVRLSTGFGGLLAD